MAELALGSMKRAVWRFGEFNLFNRANFEVPNRIAFTPNFGRIFSAQPTR
jgi:hypothetical protein